MQLLARWRARADLSGQPTQPTQPSRQRGWAGIVGTVALLCLGFLAPAAWGQPATRCADFLAAQRHKPPGLEWVGCTEGRDHQLRALIATYRVPGVQAAAVERYLVRRTGMAPLRFVCCGWEPRSGQQGPGRLPGPAGQPMRVDMHSGETLVTCRSDWSQIPWFEVRVTLPLESP
ncbi:hypothetical protein ASE52_17490 [Acidovorax sp. Root275]|nr:hypothetical protein ASE52_17490 [Acidovorax sp. Root275]